MPFGSTGSSPSSTIMSLTPGTGSVRSAVHRCGCRGRDGVYDVVYPENVTILDQSPHQLEKARQKEALKRSLETACALLRRSLERMKQMCRERCLPVLKTLIDPVFNGMQTVYDVVNSSRKKKDEDKLLRLLLHFKNQYSLLLTSEQLKKNTHSVGGIRLKPRDPRRILHYNTFRNGERSQSEPSKINDNQSNSDLSTIREQAKQTQTTSFDYLQFPQEDINQKFTCGEPTEGGNAVDQSQAPNSWGHVDHLLDGYDDQQRDAIQSERARRIEEQHKMLSAKKLSLVLDLDHTLLNSVKFSDVDATQADILRKKEKRDQEKPQRHLFRFQHLGLWTKLRPGVWNFLDRASKLFELHICTMGNKMYADEMAKVLDPKGTLFAGRVISRGDNSSFNGDLMLPPTKDLYGVLGLESAVLIIDDSLRVWPHNKNNLIVVERYNYFPSSKRQFSLPGPSLLDINHDERIENGTIASTLAVIERIHKSFFSHSNLYDVDVRNELASEQRKILSGCRILFSRIFPAEEPNPHLHPLWQTAEQFGAVCTNQIDDQVTHVVAKALGTDKVNWALSTQRYVVQPGWVEASALLYRRAKEHDFMVKK